jgi:hypothetical protein
MDEIWTLQFVFYILICFILAAVMRGVLGLICGIVGGGLIMFLIYMLINSDVHNYDTRGR